MTKPAYDIDWIVREVMRRLSTADRDVEEPTNGRGELSVESHVVTTAQLSGRLEGVRRVTVQQGAVVTPAVKDVLREKNIGLRIGNDARPASGKPAPCVVCIVDAATEPSALLRMQRELSLELQTESCLVTATDLLVRRVAAGNIIGVLLTSKTALAGCIANRRRRVRAASASSTQQVRDVMNDIGANMLIVDPAGKSIFLLEQMVTTFCRGGKRTCPAELDE